MTPATFRAFVAVPVPARVFQAFSNLKTVFDRPGVRVRWVRPSNLHLTLRFLGDVDRSAVPELEAAIRAELHSIGRFEVTFCGIGMFPNWRRPRIIWAKVIEGHEKLIELAKSVNYGLEKAGFSQETRPFRPHLTLGRVVQFSSDGKTLSAAQHFQGPAMTESVSRIVLYESVLHRSGPVYTERISLSLS